MVMIECRTMDYGRCCALMCKYDTISHFLNKDQGYELILKPQIYAS